MPTSSVVPPLWSAPLRSQLGEQKNSPPPLVVLVNKSKKIKKIVAQWVPSSVPFGDCEKRTVTRFALSFAFRLISLAQGLPFSTIYAFAFLFFSFPSDWQKIFSSPVKIFLSHFARSFCHAKNYFKTSKQKKILRRLQSISQYNCCNWLLQHMLLELIFITSKH